MIKKVVGAVIIIAVVLLAAKLAADRASSKLPVITLNKEQGGPILVDGKPFLIKGFCYNPIPIGKDYEYPFFSDRNKPWLADMKMMRDAGANTVRFYRIGKNPADVKKALDDMYYKYKMRVLMGHYLGYWDWPPPNYTDKDFNERIRGEVLEMVNLYKNHPAILMWVLGNENNYSFDRGIRTWSSPDIDVLPDDEARYREKAKIYYSYINSLAQDIKKIDPNHPVVMGVGETKSLHIAKEFCPDIDVIGMISYRGPSFGSLFREVKQKFDLPMVIIEFGADSYHAMKKEPDEETQAEFIKTQWQEIAKNADPKTGVGNSMGGTLFEWTDEWWKANENLPHTWSLQDTSGQWSSAAYYSDYNPEIANFKNMNEEWWGAVRLNPKKTVKGNYERVPRKVYFLLKSLWTKKM